MRDYYTLEEIEKQEEIIRGYEWSYTITATLGDVSPSIGDAWTKAKQCRDRFLQRDSEAIYCLCVCVNKDKEGRYTSRPHIHGFVKTKRVPSIVKASFTMNTLVLRYTPALIAGVPPDFIRYTTEQAIRDTYLHNMEKAYATN